MRPQSASGDVQVAVLATRQHGVVAHHQLREIGMSAEAIKRRVAGGRLHPVHRGVYAVGHERLSANGILIAAVLACGPGAVLSHWHAAALWGLHRTARARIDVTTTTRASPRGITVHHVRRLDGGDVTVIDAIPVTSLPRTLLDFAEVAPMRQLERAIDEAERRRLFDLAAIQSLVARSPGRRGLKPLNSVLTNSAEPPATRSEFEQRFKEFCDDAGLRQPAFNTAVLGHEVDAHWPGTELVVELDSWTHHGGRNAFEADRERDMALQAARYRVVRVTWRKLTREPGKLARQLRAILDG
jgi:very-short-patch-repair endonuclease